MTTTSALTLRPDDFAATPTARAMIAATLDLAMISINRGKRLPIGWFQSLLAWIGLGWRHARLGHADGTRREHRLWWPADWRSRRIG
jgi:hypothetical protein